ATMFLVSGVATILFLGGWNTGIGPLDARLVEQRLIGFAGDDFYVWSYLANVVGLAIFAVKAGVLVFVQIWVRWTFPRLRIDQVMMTCLKYLVPISCFLFLGAAIWPLVLAWTVQRSTVLPTSRPIWERVELRAERPTEPERVAPDRADTARLSRTGEERR
ncbi:MAG: NADH-quinone oxidoreductase subunit H, partial [Planctomycetaceae bacterium]